MKHQIPATPLILALLVGCSAQAAPSHISIPILAADSLLGVANSTQIPGAMAQFGQFENIQTLSPNDRTSCGTAIIASRLLVKCKADERSEDVKASSDRAAIQGGDYLALGLLDKREGSHIYIFFVNPRNARQAIDSAGRLSGAWTSAAVLSRNSWSAMYSIPLSTIKAQRLDDGNWRLGVLRFDSHDGAAWYWPYLHTGHPFTLKDTMPIQKDN